MNFGKHKGSLTCKKVTFSVAHQSLSDQFLVFSKLEKNLNEECHYTIISLLQSEDYPAYINPYVYHSGELAALYAFI